MKPLTLAEAAHFLRMSRSTLYQRKDIPRYRRPGSRVMLFDQDELETWLKQGRLGDHDEPNLEIETAELHQATKQMAVNGAGVVDISQPPVYHRRHLYK
ncbi:MAG: helix-turn-helix domain-containing protein [Nitrospiraceae bacterium]